MCVEHDECSDLTLPLRYQADFDTLLSLLSDMKTRLSMYRLGGRFVLEIRLSIRRLRSIKLVLLIPLL